MEIKELKGIISKIEEAKAEIAKSRDEIRVICDDLTQFLDSVDSGKRYLEDAIDDLNIALDYISERV